MAWKVGDRLSHRFNTDLGPGVIEAIEGRTLIVRFPESEASTIAMLELAEMPHSSSFPILGMYRCFATSAHRPTQLS